MIYFTSDLHLGHRGIIAMRNRPFADVEEMNRTLIANFNAVVHKDDTVYILGDLAHHMQVEDVNKIIEKLNGRKILIKGNHDKKKDYEGFFDEIYDGSLLIAEKKEKWHGEAVSDN